MLPIARVQRGAHRQSQTPVHQALPSPNEWEGRTLQSDRRSRMDLRALLHQRNRTQSRLRCLAPHRQSPPTPHQHQKPHPHAESRLRVCGTQQGLPGLRELSQQPLNQQGLSPCADPSGSHSFNQHPRSVHLAKKAELVVRLWSSCSDDLVTPLKCSKLRQPLKHTSRVQIFALVQLYASSGAHPTKPSTVESK